MDLANLKNQNQKNRKRVGRGTASGQGKTAGRGEKGQKSRSGYSRKPNFEGGQMPLMRRLPKRGFNHFDRFACAVVNLDRIEKTFDAGAEITVEALAAAGLAPSGMGIKVLARGELTKNYAFKVTAVSDAARQKIEAAGGSVALVGGRRTLKEKRGAQSA